MTSATFPRDTLASALRDLAGVVTRSPWDVLQCVRIETGSVAKLTTANEIFQVSREVETESCEGAVVAAVNAERLNAIVQSFPSGSTVRLEIEAGQVTVICNRARLKLRSEPADAFPIMAEPEAEPVTLRALDLFAAFRRVLHAADGAGPLAEWKKGVLLRVGGGSAIVVGCSSSGLARQELGADDGADLTALVPTVTAGFLAKQAAGALAFVRASGRSVSFSVDGGLRVISRLVEATYPEFERIIPAEQPSAALIDPKDLMAAMARATLVNDDREKTLRFAFEADKLTIRSSAAFGSGDEELPCDFTGEPVTIGVRADQMRATVAALDPDTLRIGLSDGDAVLSLTSVGRAETLMLVMPMRI